MVVETMEKEHLSIHATMQEFGINDHKIIERWERIYLEEGLNLTVWSLLRKNPIVWVIILPRKSAKLNPCGTRTANGHTWSGRTY